MNTSGQKYDFIFNKICPYCQSKIKQGADFIVCPHCGTPHHKECWNENGGCTTYGCLNNPQTEKKVNIASEDVGNETLESIRASIQPQGQPEEMIECPNCRSMVEESSVYCKNCGYNLDEKTPPSDIKDEKAEFEKEFKKKYKDKISTKRKRFFMTMGSFTILILTVLFLLYLTVNKLNAYFSSDEYKIKNTIDNWINAREDKDIDKYKNFLTQDYEYYGKDGKKIDYKEKLKRTEYNFKNYKNIKIKISDFKFMNDSTTTDNDRKVQFNEIYESDKLQEKGLKTIRLYKGAETNGEWKIYREILD